MGAKCSCQQISTGFIQLKGIFINTEYISFIEIENDGKYIKVNFIGNPHSLDLSYLNDKEIQTLRDFLSDRAIPTSPLKLRLEDFAVAEDESSLPNAFCN